nr:radical SAM protein [uncultured Desulfobulbus sp.]
MQATSALQQAGAQINYLILALTNRCNLSCRYCYRGPLERRIDMEPETLQRALWMAGQGEGPLHIQLSGGEPCLVPGLIELAAQGASHLNRPVTLGIQVNGTCLNDEVIRLLKKFQLQVGVSLDGPPQIQESLRGRAKETLRGLMLLEQENIPFRVTTVVTQINVLHLDRLAFLLAGFQMARGIGLDLLVQKGNACIGANSPAPAKVFELQEGIARLIRALQRINSERRSSLRLREWDLVQRMLRRGPQQQRMFCQAAQGASLAVHPDGRCFPCGQTLGDDRFATSLFTNELPQLEVCSLEKYSAACTSCPLEHCCPGDCPSRLLYNPIEQKQLACVMYQTLAEFCDL